MSALNLKVQCTCGGELVLIADGLDAKGRLPAGTAVLHALPPCRDYVEMDAGPFLSKHVVEALTAARRGAP